MYRSKRSACRHVGSASPTFLLIASRLTNCRNGYVIWAVFISTEFADSIYTVIRKPGYDPYLANWNTNGFLEVILMFGLIKLAAYTLLGYCLYEFFSGLTNHSDSWSRPQRHSLSGGMRNSIEREIRGRSMPQSASR